MVVGDGQGDQIFGRGGQGRAGQDKSRSGKEHFGNHGVG